MKKIIPHEYIPFNHKIGEITLIIYPVKNFYDQHILAPDKAAICQHLNLLYERDDEIQNRGQYHIVFVWGWQGFLMTDIWIHNPNMMGNDVGGDVAIEKCITYKEYEPYPQVGIGSDNSLVIIGREQEHRWRFTSINEYLDRSKSIPEFPDGFAPIEEY